MNREDEKMLQAGPWLLIGSLLALITIGLIESLTGGALTNLLVMFAMLAVPVAVVGAVMMVIGLLGRLADVWKWGLAELLLSLGLLLTGINAIAVFLAPLSIVTVIFAVGIMMIAVGLVVVLRRGSNVS